LLLLIPWPAALINQIIFPMQLATAQATTAVLNAFGLSATVSGELIFAPTGVFRVIESCAGLRMVDALIMAACVYSSLFYRSRLQVAILLFCAPVIALIANLGRVLSLVLNPLSTFAEIHAAQGIVVTVLGVLMLAGVDRLLESWLPSPKPDLSDRGATELADLTAAQMPSRWVRTASLSLIFSFLVLASHTIRPWQSQHELWIAPADIPARIEGWRSRTMKLDKELLGSVFVSSWTHREYQRNEETIEFFAASDNRNHRGTNLSSIKTALPQPGLAILNISRTKIAPDLPEVDVYLLGRGDLRFLSYRWSLGLENSFTESLRGALALDRSPWRLPERTLVYRVSSPFDAMAPTGRRQAEQRLRDFMLILWPELRKLEVPMAL
jgi:exosortase/archaeosortase family protein